MTNEILMPSLGADMIDATMVEWNVGPGDSIRRGDIIFAVETDKGIIDVEAFDPGVLEKILVPVGSKVPVGTPLATLRGEVSTAPAAETPPSGPPAKPQLPIPTTTSDDRHPISPAARRRARELGIDPAQLAGSGSRGAVTIEDVEQAAAPMPAQPYPSTPPKAPSKPQAGAMRKAIATAMARSKREIPHYYLATTIDLTPALQWLENYNTTRSVTERVVYAVLLLKAVARALDSVPELNGFWRDDAFVAATETCIGMAISQRGGGLVVPGLRNLVERPPAEVMAEFADVVARARSGRLRSSELSDISITVTSLGDQGVETVFPIIHPPQVAIIGFGSVVERVLPVGGVPAVRRTITASLAADHRASDGHRGAIFLAALNRLLQNPGQL